MLIFLILISLTGFFVSKYRKLGAFNPFTLFFGLWTVIFIAYFIFQHVYYPLSSEYLLVQICVQLGALFMMWFASPVGIPVVGTNVPTSSYKINKWVLFSIQMVLLIGIPLTYQKATELAGGSIFTSAGYTRLRYAYNMTGASLGWLGYLGPLSFLTSGIAVYFASTKQLSKWSALLAVLSGTAYAFLSTGRTFFLMIFILTVMPLAVTGKVRAKSMLLLGGILIGMFFVVASLTSKGISEDASFGDNLIGFVDSMQSYLLAPFVALAMLFDQSDYLAMGDHSLRFVLSLLASQGLTDPPGPIVKGYQFTPVPTNLYTVYEVYFRDFGAAGFFFPLLFLPVHWMFYKQAKKGNDFFIIAYAISAYPLMSQILQDQYMTLISMWIQIMLWCLLLIRKVQTTR